MWMIFLIRGNDAEGIHLVKSFLHSTFSIKDLGILHYFLGFEVTSSSAGIALMQSKYSAELVESTESFYPGTLLALPPVSTPLPLQWKPAVDVGCFLDDPSPYRVLLGKLNFLKNTRPDLSYAVQTLSQFMQQPS